MFTHILVPTDGSSLSQHAARRAVSLAGEIGARITAFHAIPELRAPFYDENIRLENDMWDECVRLARQEANEYLGFVQRLCFAEGVGFDAIAEMSDVPYEAIIKAAEQCGCDLIFMASHGRRGLSALILGSETHKVLTHSKIPVLVCR